MSPAQINLLLKLAALLASMVGLSLWLPKAGG